MRSEITQHCDKETNHGKGLCLDYSSIAVIKTPRSKQLIEENISWGKGHSFRVLESMAINDEE